MTPASEPSDELRKVEPFGDQGALVTFAREEDALRFAAACRQISWNWLVDVVCAYFSVAVFHDPQRIALGDVVNLLRELPLSQAGFRGRLHEIPCCYEMQLDMDRISRFTGLSADEIIACHSAAEYRVYAIGFCPGFPYLGYLDDRLSGVPRLERPRLRVEPGSVAVTGRQTGIYPLPRPGGWNVLGRTPLVLVDLADNFFPIQVGDRVRFRRIDEGEYRRLLGERLPISEPPSQESAENQA
ncbi:MAG: allophanate hydrolase subunit 1 [Gemmatales bacterium]|nr:allophanate hydrolase subunit 1 [Gemmatales bacterium]MDW8387639.1 allophanate hydrolase subunit 1 [Gemmatales bacterium]